MDTETNKTTTRQLTSANRQKFVYRNTISNFHQDFLHMQSDGYINKYQFDPIRVVLPEFQEVLFDFHVYVNQYDNLKYVNFSATYKQTDRTPKKLLAIFQTKLIGNKGTYMKNLIHTFEDDATIHSVEFITLDRFVREYHQEGKANDDVAIEVNIELFDECINQCFGRYVPLYDKKEKRQLSIGEFLMDKFTDISLILMENSSSRVIRAHKAILAARSPMFATMFTFEGVEKASSTIKINDIDYDTMLVLIKYIYNGRLPEQEKITPSLLNAADKYQIMTLKTICDESLAEQVSLKNVFNLFKPALMHDLTVCPSKCVNYLRTHFKEFKETDAWEKLTKKNWPFCHQIYSQWFINHSDETKGISNPELKKLADLLEKENSSKTLEQELLKLSASSSPVTATNKTELIIVHHEWTEYEYISTKVGVIDSKPFYSPHNPKAKFLARLVPHEIGRTRHMRLKLWVYIDDNSEYEAAGLEAKFILIDRMNNGAFHTKVHSSDLSMQEYPNIIEIDDLCLMKTFYEQYEGRYDDPMTVRFELKLKIKHGPVTFKPKTDPLLFDDLKSLMVTGGAYSDITVRIHGENFSLHRALLCGRSRYFYSCITAADDFLDMASLEYLISLEQFRDIIQYIYTNKLPPIERITLELWNAALNIVPDSMALECEIVLASHYTMHGPSSLARCLIMAHKAGRGDFKENCLNSIAREVDQWTITDKWMEAISLVPELVDRFNLSASLKPQPEIEDVSLSEGDDEQEQVGDVQELEILEEEIQEEEVLDEEELEEEELEEEELEEEELQEEILKEDELEEDELEEEVLEEEELQEDVQEVPDRHVPLDQVLLANLMLVVIQALRQGRTNSSGQS